MRAKRARAARTRSRARGARASILAACLGAAAIAAGACTTAAPRGAPSPVAGADVTGTFAAATGTGLPAAGADTPSAGTTELTVMTHDSFAVSEDVLAAFEAEHGIKVRFLQGGDAGSLVNKAVLTKSRPLADVIYGVDNTFLSRALDEGILEAYDAPALRDIPESFLLDSTHRALPVDYGDVCLNYDRAWLGDHQVPPPHSLADLTEPAYKGLVAVEDPSTSSPGLAFLLATVGHFGADAYLDYWRGLRANDVQVAPDWETAYYQDFTRAGGSRPIVVSYASSPAFEVIDAPSTTGGPPTAAVVTDRSCFRQVEFVGVLAGTEHRAAAEAWIDFMLSTPFQEDIPLQMYVFPVSRHAHLPSGFVGTFQEPKTTAEVGPADIAAHREEWITAWREVMVP